MKRKQFLQHSLITLAAPALLSACSRAGESDVSKAQSSADACTLSPRENAGPFPNKDSSQFVRMDITGDRQGVPLVTTLTVQSAENRCAPMAGVMVDIWYCDAKGQYSEYGPNSLQPKNLTNQHFLRGRQITDENGKVSFLGIYPGWYPSRAPHIHVAVLDADGRTLHISQIAFPTDISNTVYASEHYFGNARVQNNADFLFRDSLAGNLADSVTGNINEGYSLNKVLII